MLGQLEDVRVATGRGHGVGLAQGERRRGAGGGGREGAADEVAPAVARLREHGAHAVAVDEAFGGALQAAGV